jgi:hypothetical protein
MSGGILAKRKIVRITEICNKMNHKYGRNEPGI